jgi:DNA polymerase-3 subunit delta'
VITLRDLIGQKAPVALLRRALVEDRVPHALLLVGPDGVGKTTLARAFAAAALCGADDDGDACGTCRACIRVDHGNHPDFLWVTRLPKPNKKSIDPTSSDVDASDLRSFIIVDQIREMTVHAGYGPREARRRVVLIDPADRMNDEAQNALLKTLEEPSSRTVVVLTAARPHRLLPTVRSRCLAVQLAPMPARELGDALVGRGVPAPEAATRAALAGGRPGRAIGLDLEALTERREAILEDLEALAGSPTALADLPDAVAHLIGKDEAAFEEGMDLAQSLLRDAARSAGGAADTLQHMDLAARLDRLGRALGAPRAAALVAAVDEVRARTRYHANKTLLGEALLAAVAGGPLPSSTPDL